MLKFGQKEFTTKDFYGQRQITDIFMIEVNKVVFSDKVPCNNGKDCRYIVGYQVDGGTATTVYYLAMACHSTIKTRPIQCHLMFLRQRSGCLSIKRFGMMLSYSYLKIW